MIMGSLTPPQLPSSPERHAEIVLAVANDRVCGTCVHVAILPAGRLKQCDNCKKRLPEIEYPFHVYRKTLRSKCTCSDRCTGARADQKAAYRKTPSGKVASKRADHTERRKVLRRERDGSSWGKAVKKQKNSLHYATPMGMAMARIQTRARVMGVRKTSSKTIATWCGDNGQERIAAMVKKNPTFDIDHKIAIFWFMWKVDCDKLVRITEVDADALRRCWCVDNLQMISPHENRKKSYKLLSDEELLPLRHCWPAWWKDQLPSKEVRAMSNCAREYVLESCSESDFESDGE